MRTVVEVFYLLLYFLFPNLFIYYFFKPSSYYLKNKEELQDG